MYTAFIRPLLEYNSDHEVWDGCTQFEKDKLEKVLLQAARISTGSHVFFSRESLYYETGWKQHSSRRYSKKLTTK